MSVDFASIRANVAADARAAALTGIREVLTEENSDKIIARVVELVKPKLPIYLRWIPVGTVLDALLPGVLLKVFEEALGGNA